MWFCPCVGYHGKIICKVTLEKGQNVFWRPWAMQICKWCSFLLMLWIPFFLNELSSKKCTESLVFVLFLELALNIALRARHNEPQLYGSLSFTVLNRPKRDKNHFFKGNIFHFFLSIVMNEWELRIEDFYWVSQHVWNTVQNVWERSEHSLQKKKFAFCSKKMLFQPFLKTAKNKNVSFV